MKIFPLLLVLFATPAAAWQDFAPASTAALDLEATRLLWARGAENVSVTWSEAGASAAGCGAQSTALQFGKARGFAGVNGFALTNGWIEALDDDGAASFAPNACIDAEGGVGALECTSVDSLLAQVLSNLTTTQDAAKVELSFTLATATTLRFAYEFLTFESTTDPTYFDGFAIVLDGGLVAGGTTNAGPEPGSDPWTLSASGSAPASEFQSIAPQSYHVVPAHSTGRRDLVLALGAGAHTLSFHVADSRAGGAGLGCGAASDQLVSSALIVGLHEYYGSPTGVGVVSGTTLGATHWDTLGHPAPAGRFGADFQLMLLGVDVPAIVLLFVSPQPLQVPFVLGAFAPLEVLLATPSLAYTETGFGAVPFPSSGPIQVPAIVEGSTLIYQAFGLDLADGRIFSSPAKPLVF